MSPKSSKSNQPLHTYFLLPYSPKHLAIINHQSSTTPSFRTPALIPSFRTPALIPTRKKLRPITSFHLSFIGRNQHPHL